MQGKLNLTLSMGKLNRGVSLVNFSLKHNLSLQKYFLIFWITFILAGVTAAGWQQTSLTDTGATRRLVANQREVMTRLLELLYVLNIKRNIFYSVLPIPALWYFGTSVTYPPPPMISQSQISCNTHTFYISAIFVKYCYTTGSWLL